VVNPFIPEGRLKGVHAQSLEALLRALKVEKGQGLPAAEVRLRLAIYGPNLLKQAKPRSVWRIFANQFRSLVVWLLVAAGALAFWFSDWTEGVAILVVIAINTAIGFVAEIKAIRSMEALRRMARVSTRVLRDGSIKEVPAQELVPGDIVLLEAGDVVTSDLRLVESSGLCADESTLTGESLPVDKSAKVLPDETPLIERHNMLFKGTATTRGTGTGVVVATGMATELGRISALVESAESTVSPLEKRLDSLSTRLVGLTLVLAVLIAVAGISVGQDLFLMLETAIALAVAAVPEGLPIVATLALARGMWRMLRRNVLIERLSAVETLGATTVIFTDKTGTLTENRMTVQKIALDDGVATLSEGGRGFSRDGRNVDVQSDPLLLSAFEISVLCNTASLPLLKPETEGATEGPSGSVTGDPMEVALLAAARAGGLESSGLKQNLPEVRRESFDPDLKLMATYHHLGLMATFHKVPGGHPTEQAQVAPGCRVAVKGAPEKILAASQWIKTSEGEREFDESARQTWLKRNETLASEGLRMLAVAEKTVKDASADPYRDLVFVGLIGLLDPPRLDVASSLAACRTAGVRVVMVTGDQAVTAKNIATTVGLADADAQVMLGAELSAEGEALSADRERVLGTDIFARVNPKQKLDLIDLYQGAGDVVAMTGDGVNDAPALKKADIGVAMGQRGVQVAREASDMVLRDDAFSSIVVAIEQGRVIFGNIRKFVIYLLSCNLSEVLIVCLATLGGLPLPLLPLQILYLNLVTDVFPAFALGAGEGEDGIMKRPPRDPREKILMRRNWIEILGYGAVITAATLAAFAAALFWLEYSPDEAVTISFVTLASAQLLHVFNMRDPKSAMLRNEITRNPYVWGAVLLCFALMFAAIFAPGLSDVLRLVPPDGRGWCLVVAMSLVPLFAIQVFFRIVSGVRGSH